MDRPQHRLGFRSLRSPHQDLAAIAEITGANMIAVGDMYDEALELPGKQQHFQQYLHALLRLYKPGEALEMIETGMETGTSTVQILEAWRHRQGRLTTVDCSFNDRFAMAWQLSNWDINPDFNDLVDKILGHPELWCPVPYTSEKYFNKRARSLGKVDVFLHDSDHAYENMSMEFSHAWDNLIKPGGLLLSDDWSWDHERAWSEFIEREQVTWYTAGHMAMVVKP